MKYHHFSLLLAILCMPMTSHCEQEIKTASMTINDFSRLNKTEIHTLFTPSSYEELQSIIEYAKTNHLKIAISGVRHSQGGHAFFPNAIVISLEKLNQIIDFDPHNNLLTVQAGATWNNIQTFLHARGYAVKIMQFANLFTVGGSLSVNCNGIDPHFGPIIESIQSLKILLADGSIITASRFENSQLFSLAIGGYGLFGIILQATLQIVPDDLYQTKTEFLSLPSYVEKLKEIAHDPEIGFHFSFLTLTLCGDKLFDKILSFDFKKLDSSHFSKKKNIRKRKLHQEKFITLHKLSTKIWSKTRSMKALHWIPEKIKRSGINSRNNIMRPPASHLYVETPHETHLLQEYFIPIDNLITFIEALETITKNLNVNVMHVNLRFIPKNTESYLSYTPTDRVGVVVFFNQKLTSKDNDKTKEWTQYLIKKAVQLNGVYYLPIQLHATKKQALSAYPQLNNFFDLKKQYDPSELFMNHFYLKYAY